LLGTPIRPKSRCEKSTATVRELVADIENWAYMGPEAG